MFKEGRKVNLSNNDVYGEFDPSKIDAICLQRKFLSGEFPEQKGETAESEA